MSVVSYLLKLHSFCIAVYIIIDLCVSVFFFHWFLDDLLNVNEKFKELMTSILPVKLFGVYYSTTKIIYNLHEIISFIFLWNLCATFCTNCNFDLFFLYISVPHQLLNISSTSQLPSPPSSDHRLKKKITTLKKLFVLNLLSSPTSSSPFKLRSAWPIRSRLFSEIICHFCCASTLTTTPCTISRFSKRVINYPNLCLFIPCSFILFNIISCFKIQKFLIIYSYIDKHI